MNHNWEQWEYGRKTVDDDWTKEKDLKVNYRSGKYTVCIQTVKYVWVHMEKGVSTKISFFLSSFG